ncbi:HIT family protein [Euzebya sp.]|uniref:HIT family protein n=1 Tax=Euzebya sp. TaxID=1971409 RepID=UPI00351259E9
MDSPYPGVETHPAEGCTFCEVIAGAQDLVYADEHVAAFLDIRPLFPGHLLVCPVDHVVTLDQLDAALVAPLFGLVQRATAAMATALGADGAFVANNNVISQSVHHLHVHVVPRRRKDGLRGFFWPRTGYDDAAHEADVAARLREALAS